MTQQSLAQARSVDPVLTEVARGYHPSRNWIRTMLFPSVPVSARAGKILTFRPEDFQIYRTIRAPGSNTMRVQFGRGIADYALTNHSLEGAVPVEVQEEAMAVPGIDEASRAISGVQTIMDLAAEKDAADLARNIANYATGNSVTLTAGNRLGDSGVSAWSLFDTARHAIRSKTGFYPNLAVVPSAAMRKLKRDAELMDRIKYTGRDTPTISMLQEWLEVPRIVEADGVFLNDDANMDAPAFQDIWGKDIILAYVDVTDMRGRGSPSYGYTYQLRGYPIVRQPYYGENEQTWYYQYTDSRKPVLVGSSAGYIIKDAVA